MALNSNPNSGETHKRSEFAPRQRKTLFRIQNCLAISGKSPKSRLQIRWERRWTAASGAWFAILLALLFGATDWRVSVMVAGTAFMLARAGDMLDDH